MKELSIKEKAKAYEEALERAKKWYNAPNIDKMPTYGNRIIEEIFPELIEENEDEKIRKELIKFVKVNIPNEERYIAWLEKQGNPTEINPSEFDLRLNKLLKQFETLPKEELASSLSFYLNVVQNDGTYREEKQGEQNLIMAKSPQLGEQKSDNNELKFKVGDWVVENGVNGNPVQITSFEEDKGVGIKVWFSNGTGTWVDYLKGYHKWTIEDARDGDVLADNLGVVLFKSIRDNNVINYYAYLSGIFSVQKDEEYWGYAVNCTLSPATKEQRERFFAAMHDAGYEWDAEKKELKKISQCMISAEAKKAMYGKPAWGEEDELKRSTLIHVVEKLQGSAIFEGLLPEELIAWLKSLKDRVQSQPKQEWSKEDNIRLQRIIDFLWYNRKGDTDDIYQQEQDIDWLKSLKERIIE